MSSLVGIAYASAGQAGASLHTLAVQQVYQADLLKEFDKAGKGDLDAIKELRRVTDVSLRAIKETARAVGCGPRAPPQKDWGSGSRTQQTFF